MSTSVNDEMKQAADYAIKIAREKFGQVLDYSENSLPSLEKLLEQASQQYRGQTGDGKTSDDVIKRTTSIWGSYLGEVIRRKRGGEWNIDENSKRLLLINGVALSPVSYTYERITGQNQNTVKQYLTEIAAKLSPQPTNLVQSTSNPPIDTSIKNQQQVLESKVASNISASDNREATQFYTCPSCGFTRNVSPNYCSKCYWRIGDKLRAELIQKPKSPIDGGIGMKKCPYCAEEIKIEAIVCRYCGRDLVARNIPQRQSNYTTSNVPKCPTCGSTNINKISTTSKVGKVVLVGIFALGAISKTYKCNSCGHQW